MKCSSNAREIFKDLKPGDVFYHVNPLSCGIQAQHNVKIKKIKVRSVERTKFFGMFGDNVVHFKGDILENERLYLNDMDNYDCKLTTTCLKEAKAYLRNVHEGTQSETMMLERAMITARYGD